MKDYLVHADDHAIEFSCDTFNEARSIAADVYKKGLGRNDVLIDQYIDRELTGVYWYYYKGKLVRAK